VGAFARAIAAAVLAGSLGACTSTGAFECEADAQCQDGARLGRCESSGWCSFPDAACDSGYKYGTHAGDGLAEACVDPSLGSSGEPTTSVTTIGTTTGVGGTDPLDASADDTTTTADTTATATTEPLTSGPAESSTSGADATSEDTGEPVDPVFIDRFDRPDDLAIGNGWIEKHPTAFQLVDGRVVFESSASGFEDNMWYRDESELDVEVCIDFQILAADLDNHPQVHARIQPEDIEEPGQVSSYVLYVEDLSLVLVRLAGGAFQQEWSEPLPGALQVGPWYRLCSIVVGTDPVQLEGRLWVEQPSGWVLQAELLATDDAAGRITEPGATGSSAADAEQVANLVYDHFVRTILAP
jgi:hypothetical protein